MVKPKRGRPPIFDKAMSDAERKRRSRAKKKAETKAVIAPPQTIPEFQPELEDTRSWSWHKWILHFYHDELEPYEAEIYHALDKYIRLIFNVPRQHGKTTRLLRRFVVRKLCETLFSDIDENIIYFSSSKINIADFVVLVADDLEYNERIVENYGYLLEMETKKEIKAIQRRRMRSMRIKQTSFILNINTRRQLFNHSLQTITMRGQIRGKGTTRSLIDDPVDVFHTVTPEHVRKLTKKIFTFLQSKLFPASHGNISLVGTRYDVRGYDIFTMCAEEMGGRIWRHIEKKAVYEYGTYHIRDLKENEKLTPADIIIDDPKQWKLLSIGAWEFRANRYRQLFNLKCTYLQACIYMKENMTQLFWEQEFQNNPLLVASELKWELLNEYAKLTYRGTEYKWVVYVDVASGESAKAGYTAMVLVGEKQNDYFIHDLIYGKWTPKKKLEALEEFIKHSAETLSVDKHRVEIKKIRVLIETVRGQRDFFQRVRDESFLIPKPITPSKRKEKDDRIRYGLGQEMESSKVYLNLSCRNKAQLRIELDGFPHSSDNHIIDAADQAMYFLKTRKTKIKAGWL